MLLYAYILALVVLIFFINDEEDKVFAGFFGFMLGLGVFGIFGTIPMSPHNDIRYHKQVTDVHAYSNPNGGTVIVYTDANGTKRALDEGGDSASLTFGKDSYIEKRCAHNFSIWVPWKVSDCQYVVSTPSVDNTK